MPLKGFTLYRYGVRESLVLLCPSETGLTAARRAGVSSSPSRMSIRVERVIELFPQCHWDELVHGEHMVVEQEESLALLLLWRSWF